MSHCGAQTWICSCSRGELMRTSVLWINASSHGVFLYSDMKINAWSCVWESNQYYFICTSAEIKTRISLNCKQHLTPVKHLFRITEFPVFCTIMTSKLNFRLFSKTQQAHPCLNKTWNAELVRLLVRQMVRRGWRGGSESLPVSKLL